jgi:E2F/DP family winged-helix DNA-binding domain/Transcription factor DP
LAGSGGSGASSLVTLAESSLEAAAAAAAAAAATNKGLKHFSLKVCEKVEGKGSTNYNEVADELVQDMLADAAGGAGGGIHGGDGVGSGSQGGSGAHDDKNIRRRVYDALNVLEALGIIAKTKRDIEWRGWPPALRKSITEKDKLEAERAQLAARIQIKVNATQDVATKAFCLSNLVLRNRDAPLSALVAAQEFGMMAPNPLALPFMLVHAPENAEVDIDITPDERTARLDFHHYPFQIFDDENVMRMMGLGEPQPELAAAIFGGINKDSTSGGEGERATAVGAAVGAPGSGGGGGGAGGDEQLHVDHLADFSELPEFQHPHQQQQQQDQQQQPIDMSDTPLKNTTFNSGLPGSDAAHGVPVASTFAVLSPSAAVSAMDLGPDDPTSR